MSNRKVIRLKEVLKEKQMTQVSLANKMGLQKQYISDLANHRKLPSLERLYELAIALEVKVCELLVLVENVKM